MGGIWFCVYTETYNGSITSELVSAFSKLDHRGKENSSFFIETTNRLDNIPYDYYLRFYKKSDLKRHGTRITCINGYHGMNLLDKSEDAIQPFEIHESATKVTRLFCNGEIYNYNDIITQNNLKDTLVSKSDVEVILHLYKQNGIDHVLKNIANSEFAFVLTENTKSSDLKQVQIYVARDILGSKSLYHVSNYERNFHLFVSELKAIPDKFKNYTIQEIPPGSYWSFNDSIIKNKFGYTQYYNWDTLSLQPYSSEFSEVYTTLNGLICNSIKDKISILEKTDLGMFLSGGFGSCLLLGLIIKELETQNKMHLVKKLRIFTMTFLLGNSEKLNADTQKAQMYINFLNEKYNITLSHSTIGVNDPKYIISLLPEIVYAIETKNEQIIKNSVLHAILCKYIQKTFPELKVILCGDFLSTIFGKSLDSSDINEEEYFNEHKGHIQNLHNSVNYLEKLSYYYNLELRLPYLDIHLVEYLLQLNPLTKRKLHYDINFPKIDRYVLRKAFETGILPENILWRESKDSRHFSEEYTKYIEEFVENKYSDLELNNYNANQRATEFVQNKEMLYYHEIYHSYF